MVPPHVADGSAAALAIYGFKISLGGKPAFYDLLGEERFAS